VSDALALSVALGILLVLQSARVGWYRRRAETWQAIAEGLGRE
jgi:hypothetical protein